MSKQNKEPFIIITGGRDFINSLRRTLISKKEAMLQAIRNLKKN